jgi:hypothetical protein
MQCLRILGRTLPAPSDTIYVTLSGVCSAQYLRTLRLEEVFAEHS